MQYCQQFQLLRNVSLPTSKMCKSSNFKDVQVFHRWTAFGLFCTKTLQYYFICNNFSYKTFVNLLNHYYHFSRIFIALIQSSHLPMLRHNIQFTVSMLESMQDSGKVPSIQHLRAQAKRTTEMQDVFIEKLRIETFDLSQINTFEVRIAALKDSDFKTTMKNIAKTRRDQLKAYQEQKMQFERNKDKLESAKFKLEEKIITFQFLKVILILVTLFLGVCGTYAIAFQAPQFAVPQGGSIQKGTVDPKFKDIGVGIIIATGIIVVIASIGFYCWCKKCCCFKEQT